MGVDAKPPPRPLARPAPSRAEDPATDRVLADMEQRFRAAEARSPGRQTLVVDLAIGVNKLDHGLGRPPVGASVTPTVASAAFAWARVAAAQPERQVWIEVIGQAQPGAAVEVW